MLKVQESICLLVEHVPTNQTSHIVTSHDAGCLTGILQMVNGFSDQADPEIKGKVITRLQNITELQKMLLTCLSGSYNMCIIVFAV